MRGNDELMKRFADIYVERYGQELKDEQAWFEQAPSMTEPELRVERRVRGWIAARKRIPYLSMIPVLAACFILAMLFIPRLLISNLLPQSGSPDRAPTSADEPMAPSLAEPAPPAPAAPDSTLSESPDFEVIPLSAPLPQGFTQTGFDQDHGKSIYFVEDWYLDDAVITLEKADAPLDTTGLVEIDIGGVVAYGAQEDAYCLLTFIHGDILYTLTSKHDINTLIRLGSAFV